VKIGEGGIREIEFIAQALQIVRGGREPALRVRGTLPALSILDARGLMPSSSVGSLRDAYVFLRNVNIVCSIATTRRRTTCRTTRSSGPRWRMRCA
jgi:glutamine synthetase adenylyltransferase